MVLFDVEALKKMRLKHAFHSHTTTPSVIIRCSMLYSKFDVRKQASLLNGRRVIYQFHHQLEQYHRGATEARNGHV